MMKRSRLTRLLASLLAMVGLAVGSLALTTTAAEAATLDICNYSGSDDAIQVYRISSPFQEWLIGPGRCVYNANNDGGALRVDVDPSGGSADIDSWRKWRITDNPMSYPCYNNEDGSSNPYDDEATWYWTHAALNCNS